MRRVGTVILAAGKGTRMRSRFPKVSHQVGGRALLEHVMRAAGDAVSPSPLESSVSSRGDATSPSAAASAGDAEDHSPQLVIVVGHEHEQVLASVRSAPLPMEVSYVVQESQLGTADAVRAARPALRADMTTLLVLYGDTPLVQGKTLRSLLDWHEQTAATLTFLTGLAPDPTGYGRVIRDGDGRVQDIMEERLATPSQASIREVNSGVYCIETAWLWSHIDQLAPHPNGEYYLTDLVGIAVWDGQRVETLQSSSDETMGINDRVQLADAERIMRQRIVRDLTLSSVNIEDPATTYVDVGVPVGQHSILGPGTTLRGPTIVGKGGASSLPAVDAESGSSVDGNEERE